MTAVHYLDKELGEALATARYLAECGVPLFIARRAVGADGTWDTEQGVSGYKLPSGWQHSKADPAVVDRWRAGDALCMVTGVVVDGLDVDPRAGGEASLEAMKSAGLVPRSWGQATTPSGGTHDLLSPLGERSLNGLFPGVDIKAGTADGGHGFLFIAPTVKKSKVDGEEAPYRWVVAPALEELLLVGADDTGEKLGLFIRSKRTGAYDGPSYDGAEYAELRDSERAWSDRHVAGLVESWAETLEGALEWSEGQRDGRGRGWEGLARDWAWVVARLVVCGWTALDAAAGAELYASVLPEAIQDACPGKWDAGLLERAARRPTEPPPWDGLDAVRDRKPVDVTNDSKAVDWLRFQMGLPGGLLAGFFLREERVVYTPRIDETGYVRLTKGARDDDGPAQVQGVGPEYLRGAVQALFQPVRVVRGKTEATVFPMDAVRLALGAPRYLYRLRELAGVTHTPMLRGDGSVLSRPGYDEASRRLYLPAAGLSVRVPDRPSRAEVRGARELVLGLLVDFPWDSVHDRANYLALMFTPLLRELFPPPYKLGLINAHQRGSGKSLLALVLRLLHGGVFRGDPPRDEDEMRKQITSVLLNTTAPVIQLDNVKRLASSNLDALLTSSTWSDRRLGATEQVTAANDRLWIATGNNVTLGGDLVRRVLWVSIDPRVPHPELRTGFAIPDLAGYVMARRGELLGALLTLVRAWCVAGSPVGPEVGSDGFSVWLRGVGGLLGWSGFEGTVGAADTVRQDDSDEDEEWGAWLGAIYDELGGEPWTVGEMTDRVIMVETPEGMNGSSTRSIGKWLANRDGQWSGGYVVRAAGHDRANTRRWRIEKT